MLTRIFSIIFDYYILPSLMVWAMARYAYRVNEQLPANDPKKKDFHPAAVNLVPITWPIILVLWVILAIGSVVLFVLKALLYGVFLILFTLALVFIRKPFLLIWLEKTARRVGYVLLEANTALIKLFRIVWSGVPQPT